jgi:hypothetical protein
MVYDFRVYDASTFSTSHVKWTISGYPILYDLPWGVAPSVETFTKIFTTYPMNKWTNLGPLGGYGYAGGLFSPSQAKVIISHAVTQVEAGISIPEPVHFGDLAQEASARVNRNNINMIAFLKDIRNPKTMIPKLKNLSNLKTWSNNYLTVKYGVLPTISDLEHIWDAVKRAGPYIDKNGFSTYSAGRTTLVPGVCRVFETDIPVISGCEQHLKLALSNEDDGFQRIVEGLDNIGMLPTFENLWDIIPYSFVLDWFIDIGGFLERIDTHLRLERQNVRYVTMSQKESRVISFPLGSMPYVFGELTRVYYHRWTSSQCPLPPLTLQQEPTPSDHWLEGGALIFQRIK